MGLDNTGQPRALVLVTNGAADIDAGISGGVDRIALAVEDARRDGGCLARLRNAGGFNKERRTLLDPSPIGEIALAGAPQIDEKRACATCGAADLALVENFGAGRRAAQAPERVGDASILDQRGDFPPAGQFSKNQNAAHGAGS